MAKTIWSHSIGLLFEERTRVLIYFSRAQTLLITMGWIISFVFVQGIIWGVDSMPMPYSQIIGRLCHPLSDLFQVPVGMILLAIVIVIGVISSLLINFFLLHGVDALSHSWNQEVAFYASIIAWIIAWYILFNSSNLVIVKAISQGIIIHGLVGYMRAAWLAKWAMERMKIEAEKEPSDFDNSVI